jgi:hypothetical protein
VAGFWTALEPVGRCNYVYQALKTEDVRVRLERALDVTTPTNAGVMLTTARARTTRAITTRTAARVKGY